jgi:formamidopyrimidine-DNA glycosylase
MPELPEVEVTRRALAPYVEGRVIERVTVRERRLRWPVPAGLERQVARQRIERLDRRGKYLLWRLPHGVLLSHLGMSGVWRVLPRARGVPAPLRHDHVDLLFAADCVRFTDPRRFGALLWHPARAGPVDRHPLLAGLGIEPFDPAFDGAWLHRGTRGRDVSIKQALLAGNIVVGVGNIYASESLFRAGIDPRAAARRLGPARCVRLADAIRAVLTEAIAAGGSTLRDFVGADGAQGYFMMDAAVYERGGQPCRTCGAPIARIVQGQRATYFCRRCQHR